jgi:hypothetical protein
MAVKLDSAGRRQPLGGQAPVETTLGRRIADELTIPDGTATETICYSTLARAGELLPVEQNRRDIYAKRVKNLETGAILYYIMLGGVTKTPFNPWGAFNAAEGKGIFVRVNEDVFDNYINFLTTRNPVFYNDTQRLYIHGK